MKIARRNPRQCSAFKQSKDEIRSVLRYIVLNKFYWVSKNNLSLSLLSSNCYMSPSIPSIFVIRMVQNEIPSSECFFLLQNGSERTSELFYLLRNDSERNSEFFVFRGMARNGIPSILRSAEQTEFRRNESKFPSVPCSAEFFFPRKMATRGQIHYVEKGRGVVANPPPPPFTK
jgi:hypothetical protein